MPERTWHLLYGKIAFLSEFFLRSFNQLVKAVHGDKQEIQLSI